MVFAAGNREQYGAEGLVVSLMIMAIAILFISILVMGEKFNKKSSFMGSLIALAFIFIIVNSLESIYKGKSWYGPSFSPPDGYLSGPITNDQGNNIWVSLWLMIGEYSILSSWWTFIWMNN